MTYGAGELYGYHVASVLWVAAHNKELREIWFDAACHLLPFVRNHVASWAGNADLCTKLGVTPDIVRCLGDVRFCVDNFHCSTHSRSCQVAFMGRFRSLSGTNRGGECVRAPLLI